MAPIRCCSWNANGLRSRVAELRYFIKINKLDLILVSETKLTPEITIKIKNFTIIRNDRTAHGGGVAIIIRSNVPYKTTGSDPTIPIENTSIQLRDGTYIIAVYNPPRNQLTIGDLHTLTNKGNKALIIGDFNAKHFTWKNPISNHNGRTLFNFISNNDLILHHTDDPTHFPDNGMTPSHIDLILNKNVRDITEPISKPDLSSDHYPIMFEICNQNKEDNIKTITTYKNTNWEKFREDLSEKTVINNNINSPADIDRELEILTQNMQQCKNKHCKQMKIDPNKIDLDQYIIDLIKYRNRIRKVYQRTLQVEIKHEINKTNRTIRNKIKQSVNKKWEKTLQELKPGDRTLWKITKSYKTQKDLIPTITRNNETYLTDKEKADIISETLENIQKNNEKSTIENQVKNTITNFNNEINTLDPETIKLTNPKEVQTIIKELPSHKAPGADKIENRLLKNLPRKTIVQIMYLINGMLKIGYFPNNWKTAIIIPIPKPGKDHTNPTNYRPISLLSSLSKVAEKIILKRIVDFDNKNKIMIEEQFGFRRGHNTSLQVARIANSIITHYNKSNVTSMTLLDIEKAFDTVWIDGIVSKLIKYKFPAYLIRLINNYLTNRTFKVKINEVLSIERSPKAGVPQGSVLGPVLFSYFINDIPKFVKTNLAIYADDTAVYAHSFNAQVATKQCEIHCNQISDFASTWKIKINKGKTEHIIFTRKFTNTKVYTPLNIDGMQVKQAAAGEVRYLGVIMDQRLSFGPHIKGLVNKGHKIIRSLYSLLNRNSHLSVGNKKLLYTAIIRPIITYACPIWCSASKTSINKLQRIQNKCIRLILTRDRYTKIKELHKLAGLQTIVEFTQKISNKFYKTQLKNSNLTRNLTNQAQLNLLGTYKHKHTFHKLSLN